MHLISVHLSAVFEFTGGLENLACSINASTLVCLSLLKWNMYIGPRKWSCSFMPEININTSKHAQFTQTERLWLISYDDSQNVGLSFLSSITSESVIFVVFMMSPQLRPKTLLWCCGAAAALRWCWPEIMSPRCAVTLLHQDRTVAVAGVGLQLAGKVKVLLKPTTWLCLLTAVFWQFLMTVECNCLSVPTSLRCRPGYMEEV